MYYETAEKLLEFIRKSPTAFHAVDTMKKTLAGNGFQELSEKELWSLTPGGNYMVTRNNSALVQTGLAEISNITLKSAVQLSHYGKSQRFSDF